MVSFDYNLKRSSLFSIIPLYACCKITLIRNKLQKVGRACSISIISVCKIFWSDVAYSKVLCDLLKKNILFLKFVVNLVCFIMFWNILKCFFKNLESFLGVLCLCKSSNVLECSLHIRVHFGIFYIFLYFPIIAHLLLLQKKNNK